MDNSSFLALSFAEGFIKAIEGERNAYRITLGDVGDNFMFFKDRPSHKSGPLGLDVVIADLQAEIARETNPNFAVQFIDTKGAEDYEMFTLNSIRTSADGDKIIGRAELIDDRLPAGDFLTQYQKDAHGLLEAALRDGTAIFTPTKGQGSASKQKLVKADSGEPIAYDFGFTTSGGGITRVSGKRNLYEMEMKIEHPNVTYLSEFPYRKSGLLTLEEFTTNWQGYGFSSTPPNAEIHVVTKRADSNSGRIYPATIENIEYDTVLGSGKLTFKLLDNKKYGEDIREALRDSKGSRLAFESSSIFVDSVSHQYLPDPVQALNFKPDIFMSLGQVRSLSINSVNFPQDLTSTFSPGAPNNLGTTPVTGFIASVAWSGNALEPITISLLVSHSNDVTAIQLANTPTVGPWDVSIDFSVYEPNLIGRTFYEAFATLGSLKGAIATNPDGSLAYHVDLLKYTGIALPSVYMLSLAVMPAGPTQQLKVANSPTSSATVPWG